MVEHERGEKLACDDRLLRLDGSESSEGDVGGRQTIGQMAAGGSPPAVVPCRRQGLQRKLPSLAPKAAFLIRLQSRLDCSPNLSMPVLGLLVDADTVWLLDRSSNMIPSVTPTQVLPAPLHRGHGRHLSTTGRRKQARRLANELPTAPAGTLHTLLSMPMAHAKPPISVVQ